MKLFVVLASFLITISAISEEEAWVEFKQNYSKVYKSLREDKLRFQIFKSNLQMISEHNKRYAEGYESYTMRDNQFTDLTSDEFKKMYLGHQHPHINEMGRFQPPPNYTAPDSIDWRSKGAVLSVKDQGQCESCWAFSAVGALEGQNAIKHGSKEDLSEQELVDCSVSYGNHGCKGGLMDKAFKYVQANGISSAALYPYIEKDQACAKSSHARASFKVSGYNDVATNEKALQAAVASVGPISVGIESTKIQFYDSGIFDNAQCGHKLDHGVLVVGYGSASGKDFWIVKNSWGSSWGEKGYIRMVRNKGNQCGIALLTSYPVII